ncbi:cation-dependent mannose-6-phosphate receptor-like [Liolophura sinensis]|uniref:cation-dependent mannose-6-phosphate receptor-like n=1 Tax=Liolophura sinensis TaxID=3198878 RepID=UPI0031585E65
MTASGEDPLQPTNYYLQYSGKYACTEATPISGGSEGLSPGSIICIVFLALLFVYVAGGVAVQIFVRKESGVKAIPQSSFWISLPSLIRDGFFFVIRYRKREEYSKT